MVSRSDMSCFSENQGQFCRVAVEYVEYYKPPDVLWLSADNTSGPQPLNVAFHLEIMSASGPLSFLWDFGDGTILYPSLHGNVVHTYTKTESTRPQCDSLIPRELV